MVVFPRRVFKPSGSSLHEFYSSPSSSDKLTLCCQLRLCVPYQVNIDYFVLCTRRPLVFLLNGDSSREEGACHCSAYFLNPAFCSELSFQIPCAGLTGSCDGAALSDYVTFM